MDFYTMNTPWDREINITKLQKPAMNLFFIPIPTSLSELPPYWPFVVVQSLSCVQLFATPWAAARQASLSFTISWSLLKLMSIESAMPSNHLALCPLCMSIQNFLTSLPYILAPAHTLICLLSKSVSLSLFYKFTVLFLFRSHLWGMPYFSFSCTAVLLTQKP